MTQCLLQLALCKTWECSCHLVQSLRGEKHCCKEVIKSRGHVIHLPTMSLRICSVMGIGLAASGDMYLVKMLTASLSIPANSREQKNDTSAELEIILTHTYNMQSSTNVTLRDTKWQFISHPLLRQAYNYKLLSNFFTTDRDLFPKIRPLAAIRHKGLCLELDGF